MAVARMVPGKIIIHCSATPDGREVSWGAIRRFHVEQRGWRDIGYHYGIELVGDYYEILQGRFPDEEGAHCRGQNYDSIGVCLVGSFDEQPPPEAQIERAIHLVAWLCRRFVIPAKYVYGHREFDPKKTCPGAAFDLDKFRFLLRKEMGL